MERGGLRWLPSQLLPVTLAVLLSSGLQPVFASGGRCLLVDTDMDLDDAMALAYSCLVATEDLRAVTLAGTGFMRETAKGIETADRLLQLFGCGWSTPVAIAAGRGTPLSNSSFHFPAAWSVEAQRFFDQALPPLAPGPPGRQAAESTPHQGYAGGGEAYKEAPSAAARLMVETAAACRAEGLRLDVVATAPLTNLAEALRLEPRLLREVVGDVFFAGGNLNGVRGDDADCGGHANTAECNIFLDVLAASEVMGSGLQLHVMDTVSVLALPLPKSLPGTLVSDLQSSLSPQQQFLIESMRVFMDTSTHQLYFYDPAVAVWRHQMLLDGLYGAGEHSPGWGAIARRWTSSNTDVFCLLHSWLQLGVSGGTSRWYGTLNWNSSNGAVDLCQLPSKAQFALAFFRPFFGDQVAANVRLVTNQNSERIGALVPRGAIGTVALSTWIALFAVAMISFALVMVYAMLRRMLPDTRVLGCPLLA